MHHVTSFDPGSLGVPSGYEDHGAGYRRVAHIDRGVAAVHTGLGTCELAPGGRLDSHVHSYEELVYVIEGEPELTLDGVTVRLRPDESVFIGVGATHEWRNSGDEPCRWIDLQAPQSRGNTEPRDTFFVESPDPGEAKPLDVRDPRARRFSRWDPGQMDLDRLKQPVPADAPAVSASMSSALLAYAGITVKMLLDERHGAFLGNMFMVDYYPGVLLHPHDHPLEEAFYMLEGEVLFVADGSEYTLREGDVAYAGVGCIHSFENQTSERCRWLETRSPQPPPHHAYRFNRDWASLDREDAPVA